MIEQKQCRHQVPSLSPRHRQWILGTFCTLFLHLLSIDRGALHHKDDQGMELFPFLLYCYHDKRWTFMTPCLEDYIVTSMFALLHRFVKRSLETYYHLEIRPRPTTSNLRQKGLRYLEATALYTFDLLFLLLRIAQIQAT